MGRTVSVAPPDPDSTDDLDGRIVDGLEALRQRLVQAVRFRLGTWFLARTRGLDYERIIGHRISPGLAAAALNDTIRTEGGDEVIDLADVAYSLDRPERVFRYSVRVESIHGSMTISEVL